MPDAAANGGASGSGGGAPDAAAAVDAGRPVAEACAPHATFALVLDLDVTWAGNSATTGGAGRVHIWNKAALNTSGNAISGQVTGCGTALPETTLTGLGRLAAGGNKILIQVPDAIWDAPGMPKYALSGARRGPDLGATIELGFAAPLGFDPGGDVGAPWPDSYQALHDHLLDADGDGKPGYLALPRADGGYVLPPTSLGLGGLAPAAEKVFLVTHNRFTLSATRTACDDFSGAAAALAFDSHVVGCVVHGGGDCSPGQVDFVDQNRMKYLPKSATFAAKRVPDAATCAEVRAALPR